VPYLHLDLPDCEMRFASASELARTAQYCMGSKAILEVTDEAQRHSISLDELAITCRISMSPGQNPSRYRQALTTQRLWIRNRYSPGQQPPSLLEFPCARIRRLGNTSELNKGLTRDMRPRDEAPPRVICVIKQLDLRSRSLTQPLLNTHRHHDQTSSANANLRPGRWRINLAKRQAFWKKYTTILCNDARTGSLAVLKASEKSTHILCNVSRTGSLGVFKQITAIRWDSLNDLKHD
jgi:hypothetical protein